MSSICDENFTAYFKRTSESLNLLRCFWQRDDSTRQEEFNTLLRTFDSWYFGFGSPASPGFLESVVDDTGGATHDTTMHGLIKEQIADLVRIYYTCPLADLRASAEELLLDLKTKKGFTIMDIQFQSPSSMISRHKIPHIDCFKEDKSDGDSIYSTYRLFQNHWFQWGRLENYISVMGFHPEYLEWYMNTKNYLFDGELPLPYVDRFYLAVLAAAEQRCLYLVLLFARQYIAAGGDANCLNGLNQAPVKWRQLVELNRDLATRPWRISAEHIDQLTHGGDLRSSGETLSLGELMHAVTILTHVHALACLIFSCGIHEEIDQMDVWRMPTTKTTTSTIATPTNAARTNGQSDVTLGNSLHHSPLGRGDDELSSRSEENGETGLNRARNNNTDRDGSNVFQVNNHSNSDNLPATQLLQLIENETSSWEDVDEDIVAEQFREVVQSNKELDSEHSSHTNNCAVDTLNSLNRHPVLSRFLDSVDHSFSDFDGKAFNTTEYKWQGDAFPLADRLCNQVGSLLDEKFRNAYLLTYNTLRHITDVDTSLYRRSVWNLVQSLFGICNDEFRYDCIDRLLDRKQRAYLKLCATRPYAVNPRDHQFETVFPALSPSEVVTRGHSSLLPCTFLQPPVTSIIMDKLELIENRFRELDRNGDGRISREEYLEELKRRDISSHMIGTLMRIYDTNQDGFITKSEFIDSMVTLQKEYFEIVDAPTFILDTIDSSK